MKKIIITNLLILISLSLQSQSWWNTKKINGNGNIISQKRTIENFDKIIMGGSFNIILVDKNDHKITIEGEENIIPYITTEVRRNTLKVNFKENTNINLTKRLTIFIPVEEIEEISLNGSGNITSEKKIKTNAFSLNLNGSGNVNLALETASLTTSISGSGNINLKGITDKLTSSISGSGNLNAYNLTVDELTSKITGSGNTKTTVATIIDATIIGSGSIYYKGTAKYIDSNIVGSGDVVERN